ncbi:uncharacterized protein [Spinacia oleracea]|uniref:Uncharacterized protein n=1 Tax=Spinacia oleracea TaxID=3562 RepID=A0ABM3RVB5_SPIOL|nr:uncharacterized protein LOC110777934 [Spinacia oleracea]
MQSRLQKVPTSTADSVVVIFFPMISILLLNFVNDRYWCCKKTTSTFFCFGEQRVVDFNQVAIHAHQFKGSNSRIFAMKTDESEWELPGRRVLLLCLSVAIQFQTTSGTVAEFCQLKLLNFFRIIAFCLRFSEIYQEIVAKPLYSLLSSVQTDDFFKQ